MGTPFLHISDLRSDEHCLETLIPLYFQYGGQTKSVAEHLGIRRNSVIDLITERLIPQVCKIWIEECQGDPTLLSQTLKMDGKSFHKGLRWHHRFESYLSSIDVDSENRRAIARALHFLRNIPEPFPPAAPSAKMAPGSSAPERRHLTRNDPGTDNATSISKKITKMKTLRFGTMMILGESGAGKGWLATRIHEYLYPNNNKPYIHINCAHLISATIELFGSVRGAFTDAVDKAGAFELVANGGTLFLDEIDALPVDVQMKLLLVLGEDGMFYRVGSTKSIHLKRFSLITATNQDLEKMVEQNLFRQDLLGRINQPCIRLKTWHQQPTEVKLHIIQELQHHISEHDFEVRFRHALQNSFQLNEEQKEVLLNSRYAYNIRSVRKQITEFMAQFILDSCRNAPAPFKIQ